MARDVLEDILNTLQYRTPQGSISKIPASKLLELRTVLPGSTLLEDMLSATLVSQLPPGFDGHVAFVEGQLLSTILSGVKSPRMNDLPSLPVGLFCHFLGKETWTPSTGNIIVAFLYSNSASVQAYTTWLNSKRWTRLDMQVFAPVLTAFFDCIMLADGELSQVSDDVLHDLLNQLFLGEQRHGCHFTWHLECIHKILALSGTRRARLVSALEERIQATPIMDLAFAMTFLARNIFGVSGCGDLTTSIVDRALQWAVRHLSDDVQDSEDSNMALENLSGSWKSRFVYH